MIEISRILIQRPYITPDFTVITDSDETATTLISVFEPYACESSQTTDSVTIELIGKDCSEIQQIINTIYKTSKPKSGYTLLHAAAVALDKTAFILAGKTQSGKSTLTAYLCNNGFTYLTDDITVIDNKTLEVLPYRKSIMLRQGSLDVLKKHGIHINTNKYVAWNNESRYPYKPIPRTNIDRFKLGGIYTIERNSSDLNNISQLPSGDAFLEIMTSTLYYEKNTVNRLTVARDLVNRGCFRLNYSSMDYVLNELKDRVLNER
ncbi:MAG: hypothetical protein KAH14_10230 [Clostridiales bacterium]|nr:hypothetical protein [Clostridiales bacterium]